MGVGDLFRPPWSLKWQLDEIERNRNKFLAERQAKSFKEKAMSDFEIEKKGSDFEAKIDTRRKEGESDQTWRERLYSYGIPDSTVRALQARDYLKEEDERRIKARLPPIYKDMWGPKPKVDFPFFSPRPVPDAPGAGRKDDAAKDRFELLPGDALRAIAVILTFGAAKYGDRNWEKGMKWSRVYGALQRHLNDWWQGEALDAETGKSHLAHAGCCLLFLIAYEIRTVGEDDRPKARTSS